jgi:hypothetical protein
MKNTTYRRAQEHGIDVKQVSRQDRVGLGGQNAGQVWRRRLGAGLIPASLRIFQTVDGATL